MAVYYRRRMSHFVLRFLSISADLMGREPKGANPILLTVGASPIFNGADENIGHFQVPSSHAAQPIRAMMKMKRKM